MAGLVPWFYMQSMLPGGSGSLRRYTYLITKIKYPISTIPTFVNLSEFFIHLMLLGITIIVFVMFGYVPDKYYLQLPVYMFMVFIFFNAWSLFAGMLGAISRDFHNFIKSITIAFFWLSGIIYAADSIQIVWLRRLMLWNPVTIIVNGYRYCFIYKHWFWEMPRQMKHFIILYLLLATLSVWAYRKLHKDIPDVLQDILIIRKSLTGKSLQGFFWLFFSYFLAVFWLYGEVAVQGQLLQLLRCIIEDSDDCKCKYVDLQIQLLESLMTVNRKTEKRDTVRRTWRRIMLRRASSNPLALLLAVGWRPIKQ